MTKNQRYVVLWLSFISIIGGVSWQYYEPGFEPLLFVVGGLIGLFSQWWPTRGNHYSAQRLTGRIKFNFSNNNGHYKIGGGDLLFETVWSKASDTSIHIYNDSPSIDSLALAHGIAKISDISSVLNLDFSSRSRTAEEGDIIILKNKYGKYAALKIIDIKDQSRSDSVDEVIFDYIINRDGKDDFR